MKTLFQPFHMLSRHLHENLWNNKLFSNAGSELSEQLQEDGNSFIISVPVPGLSREDLSVYIDGRLLFITKKRQAQLSVQSSGLRQEGKYSFVLPDGINADRIEAKCRHGLLTIKLNKTQRKKHHAVIKVLGDENGRGNGRLENFGIR